MLSRDELPCAGMAASRRIVAKALNPLMAAGLAEQSLSMCREQYLLNRNVLPCAGKTPSKKMMAKALDPLMATGLAGLALSIELLGLLMLAPAWHDIVKVCPAAPADLPHESCLQEFHCGLVRKHCAVGGPRKENKQEMGDDCQEQPLSAK